MDRAEFLLAYGIIDATYLWDTVRPAGMKADATHNVATKATIDRMVIGVATWQLDAKDFRLRTVHN